MHRRQFLATTTLSLLPLISQAAETTPNAFSPLKTKLTSGKDAVLFINGDSTSYEKHGPYYLFAKSIGEATDSKIILHRWAEWNRGTPSGPKQYDPPETLRPTGKATLTVYLATLPGAVSADMFAGARRGNAIDAIPAPDCCILHHGHNMRDFPQALPGDRSSGRGMILATLAMTSMKWPGVPQAITNQNPWKNGDEYKAVLESIQTAATQLPVTLIDSHSLFLNAGKTPDLYRPNDVIHPSDSADNHKGAQLVADALLATWNAAPVEKPFTTPLWPALSAPNLLTNGDFKNFPANAKAPVGWNADNAATVIPTDDAIAIHPNGNQNACLTKILTKEETAAIAGKTVTLIAEVRSFPDQLRAFGNFVCRSGGETRTFAFLDRGTCKDGWFLLACDGIRLDPDQPGPVYLKYLPAFHTTAPTSNSPLLIRSVRLVIRP